MPRPATVRPVLSSAATLLLAACEPHRSVQPSELESPPARGVSTYFPPSEADGGWRKRTTAAQIRELGLEAAKGCTSSASTSWHSRTRTTRPA
jgi:hypothetical protein